MPERASEPLNDCTCSTRFLATTLTGHAPECPTRRNRTEPLFDLDTRTIRAWLARKTVSTDILLAEFYLWAEHFAGGNADMDHTAVCAEIRGRQRAAKPRRT